MNLPGDRPRKEEKGKLLERAGIQKGALKSWATADASARDGFATYREAHLSGLLVRRVHEHSPRHGQRS
jgi:hypothetical protein